MTKRERLARTRGAAPTTAAHTIDLDGIDIRGARVHAIPLTTRFRGITIREGMLAVEAATVGWPEPVRDRVPINATVPVGGPQRAHEIVSDAGSLRPVGGYLPVPRTPPDPAPALLDTYELTDPRQVTWWRERLRHVSSW
jgi:Enolase N-terminal domain-like